MKTRPIISIIIPTLQEENYIGVTLSRLASINPPSIPFEIIVVDGGSTDNTVEISKRFTNKVYRIHERGIAKAKNFGAKRASGEILVFLDADVNPSPSFLEKTLEIFTDFRVAGATCDIMPIQSSLLERAFFHFYNGLLRFVCGFRAHSRGEFLAVRKKAFLAVNGFNENLPCIEDHDLAYRLSRIGKFVYINGLTVYESLRRFRKLGLHRVVGTWFINYLAFLIRGRPLSKIWKPIR